MIVLIIVGIYLLILFAIAWFSLHPLRTPIFVSPGFLGVPQESIEFPGPVGLIRGWFVPNPDSKEAVLLVHGYLMNRAELAPVAARLYEAGYSCLLIDLRAHGRSQGRKCTLGYRERDDVRAALLYLRERCAGQKIAVVGSSMGAAASALALGDDPTLADLLVLDSGYSRLSVAILGWWNFLGGKALQYALGPSAVLAAPIAGFWPFSVDTAAAITKFGNKPVLILHGTGDTLAPPSEAERNAAACRGVHEIVWFERYQHSEYRWEDPEKYFRVLIKFLGENLRSLN